MLYGKIYLDTIDGREALIFASLIVPSDEAPRAECVDYIAISPEAREVFAARLRRDCPTLKLERYRGDLELYRGAEWEHGYFSFKEENSKDGIKTRALFEKDPLSLCVAHGSFREALGYMVPCDNEALKAMDLREHIDENALWSTYFTEKRARGEELGCDPATIKRTPLAFFTEEQKATVKADYHHHCGRYDSQEWHYHGDFIEDKIVDELMVTYGKSDAAIRALCRIHNDN